MKDWWLQVAYLGYRTPVIVHSSPGTVGPPITFNRPDDVHLFAARLVAGVCNYNEMIKRQVLYSLYSFVSLSNILIYDYDIAAKR